MSKIRLSDVVDINKSTFKLNTKQQYIYYLDTANITKNTISNIQKLYLMKDDIPSRAKRAVSNDTIIYSSVRPNLCHFGILSNVPSNMVVSTGFITLDVKNNKIDPYYLFYLITTEEKINYITNIANTSVSSYPSITPEILGNMEFEIIDSLNEQKYIGKLLKSIDDKIKLNNKINTELEAMAKTIYDYWFLQFEFPNEEGKPYKSSGGKMVWNEELKREIPEGWEVVNLSSCIKSINTGLNPRKNFKLNTGKIKYITVKNINIDGSIDFSNCDTIDNKAQKLIQKRSDLSKGDILFASIAPLGRCYLLEQTPVDWNINESVFSIRPNDNISSYLLYYYLISDEFIKKATYSSVGSIFQGIRITTILNIKVVLPSKKIINYFDSKISSLVSLKYKRLQENQELTSLKDFLLPLLMNGQVGFKN